MPWTKLKNIILLILVLTNLFLLGLVVSQSLQNKRQDSQTREHTILFLSERGVEVKEETIPDSIDLLPQAAERDLEKEEQTAAALLKGEVEKEARGGEIYRYSNQQGWIQFHGDGFFSAQLEPGVYPAEQKEDGCAAVLEALGVEGTLLEETEEGLIFQETWNGVPLFGQQVSVFCAEGSVSTISGQCLTGELKADYTRKTITLSTALVRFLNGVSTLGDVCNRIDRVEEGYLCTASLTGTMTLTPAWQVTTDTGTYQLDTVTGTVRRAE